MGERIIRFWGKSAENTVRDGLSRLYPRLWRFALALTRDRSQADDLAQRACLRALEKCDQFTPGTRLDSWLFRIAQTIHANELRHTRVRIASGEGTTPGDELPCPYPGPEDRTHARSIVDAVFALPEAQRTACLLVYVEGFKYREAADLLDIPIGTVMSRLAAARKSLNQRFAADMTGTN